MKPIKFLASDISRMKVTGRSEWGIIFYQDETFRQSYDQDDATVVVEKNHDGEWRCFETYRPVAARKVLDENRTKRVFHR